MALPRRILSGEGPYDTAYFHSQQATEKTFKALLAYRGQPIPSTDLEELARLCQQLEPIPECAKVRRAGLPNLILAVSERLKVGEGDLEGLPGPVVFFKGKLDPRKVLEVTESLGAG
jgi:HEPN domain